MSIIIFFIIALILPIALSIYIYSKTRLNFSTFIIGFLTFFIPQVLIRIPILYYLTSIGISYSNTFPKQILLALSAGLVEVGADYIAYRFVLKKNTLGNGFIIGLSHGFCENLIIVSLPIILSILNGNLISISYMASFERLFALVAHISFALFAFYAVKHKNLIYLILGILLHALSDSLIFILSNIYIMESAFALISIASFIAIIYIISKDKNVSKYDDIKLFI